MQAELLAKDLIGKMKKTKDKKSRFILAIDGRCGSGKTTLAETLEKKYGATVFHMDDFYLQQHQRTPERYAEPGGNVDRERFLEEVLIPLREGKDEIKYRPLDCSTFTVTEGRIIRPGFLCIVEGSYSLHPELRDYYDYTCFLDIDPNYQLERLMKRNSEDEVKRFIEKWIPLEEAYFNQLNIREYADKLVYIRSTPK